MRQALDFLVHQVHLEYQELMDSLDKREILVSPAPQVDQGDLGLMADQDLKVLQILYEYISLSVLLLIQQLKTMVKNHNSFF